MAGNSIGQYFKVTTFGESHGITLGCIIDGVPPNISLNESDIQHDLNKRKPGSSEYVSERNENDKVEIQSGVFNGKTTGTSIGLIIKNNNYISKDYDNLKNILRPGHADYTYQKKYGIRDYRGGGRSSGRETVMRVAAGAIAKKYLYQKLNIKIYGFLSQMGNIKCLPNNLKIISNNSFFCADNSKLNDLKLLINKLKKNGDSIGSKISIIIKSVPIGLGEPVFDKLDADLAHALMSINAVKGVEIGSGFNVINQYGSENRDEITEIGFKTNNSGGILGGISNGDDIIINLAIKPTSSISKEINTISKNGINTKIKIQGRHDPCIGIRAIPVSESMVAIVLMDHLLRQRAQCGKI